MPRLTTHERVNKEATVVTLGTILILLLGMPVAFNKIHEERKAERIQEETACDLECKDEDMRGDRVCEENKCKEGGKAVCRCSPW